MSCCLIKIYEQHEHKIPASFARNNGAVARCRGRNNSVLEPWLVASDRLLSNIQRFVEETGTETRLLRRLQKQTLPDATLPIGKIHQFSKIAITFEPIMQCRCPSRFAYKNCNIVYFINQSTIFNHEVVAAP